jgi:hypothetical protein
MQLPSASGFFSRLKVTKNLGKINAKLKAGTLAHVFCQATRPL